MPLEQFVAQLEDSGVISAAEIAAFQESHTPPAESAEDLGKLLVKHKKVTKLQAQMVYQGKGDRLLLGNYIIQKKIGAGGMGDVYLAKHKRMKRKVALKTLPAKMTQDQSAIRRFEREVEAAAKLSHPNIVAAHDADEANGIHYFVMEYVDGIDLSAVVKKEGVLQVDVAVNYILQAATGLEYAHEEGIIHRDIKPANLLLDKKGTIKILDMGLARIEDEAHEIPATQLTQDGSVMGTVDYMAPEQAKDTHTADARSDIYSLGCSLYYLLTGESVYRGSTMVNRIMAHQNDPIPSLTGKHILISQDVDAVFQKMVAKKPEDRFQSMSEVIVAIENCIQMKSSSTVATEPSDPELQKFLQSQKFASSPTVVMSADAMAAEIPLTDTQNESLTSGFLNNTLGGTVFQPLQKRMQSIGKWGWIIAGTVLASLILLAGIILKVDTSAGIIILEIDQPELAGAVVSVDDQQKITIKAGKGTEPIEVVADEKTHTLQVTKGGFETFTKQFTVNAGGKETIKVRLMPLKVAEKKMPSAGTPAKSHSALRFQNRSDHVALPLKHETAGDLTVEAWVTIDENTNQPSTYITNVKEGHGLFLSLASSRGDNQQWGSTILNNGEFRLMPSHSKVEIGKRTNIAVIYKGNVAQIYVNGHKKGKMNFKELDILTDGPFSIGWVSNQNFKGSIDEVRFSNIARYSEDFTPTDHFENDKNTLALYHFDEGTGDVLKDASGNGHDGKIFGAKWVKVDDELQVAEPATTSDKPMTDREVAEWVIGMGGWVNTGGKNITKIEQLPTEPFIINFLDLKGTRVQDEDLKRLAGLKTLPKLNLENTLVSDTGLQYLKDIPLNYISLIGTQITDKGFGYLSNMPSLTTLYVGSTAISNSGVEQLKDMKQLEKLSFTNTQIDGVGLGHLKDLKNLKILGLESTSISDVDLQHLHGLKILIVLGLSNCKIADSGLAYLKDLKNLKVLSLDSTPITDVGLKHLSGLKMLQTLELQKTKVTPQGIADLQKALPNCKILSDFETKPTVSAKGNYEIRIQNGSEYVTLPLKHETAGDLTIEAWVTIDENSFRAQSFLTNGSNLKGFHLGTSRLSPTGEDTQWTTSVSNHGKYQTLLTDSKVELGKRTNIVVTFKGTIAHIYVNGHKKGELNFKGSEIHTDQFITIGNRFNRPDGIQGSIDEFRISNVVRYTKDFTPENHFENDKNTLALYHFDEGSGDILKDSSGNGHDGKIVGAKWVKVDDELQVVKPATKSEKHMTDREIAEWVVSIGGTLRVNNKEDRISRLEDLPKEPFFIISISFSQNENMTDHRLRSIKELKHLEGLYIEATPVTNAGMQDLAQLTSLTKLDISSTAVGDEGLQYLAGLEKLTYLSVQATKITDVGLKHLTNLRNLTSLNLNVTMTGDQGLEYIKNLINLTVLNGGKLTTDEGLKHLSQMKQLQRISFDATRITGSGLVHLPDPEKLVNLNLQGSPVTDENLQNVSKFTNLQVLYLRGTKITDAGLKYLESLKQLKNLTLEETKITDTGLKHLESMKRLESLNLQETKVTPQGIADLQKALPNCKIVSEEK